MSPKELEEIKARHHGNEFNTCDGCVANLEDELVDYPCEAFRLVAEVERLRGHVCPAGPPSLELVMLRGEEAQLRAEVERLRAVVRVVESEHYRVFSPEEPPEGGCICMAYPCPELEALDAVAALGGEE